VAHDTAAAEPEIFYTAAGRPVYGGGGIVPDVDLPVELYEPIEINLERQGLFFSFAVQFVADHPDLPLEFEVDDHMLNDFRKYIEEKKFTYTTRLESEFQELGKSVAEQGKDSLFKDALARLEELAETDKADDFDESREYIRQALQRTVLRNKFGERGVYEQVILKEDPAVLEALKVIRSKDDYSKLLTGPSVKPEKRQKSG
jgi:carboxyl-terminal processing protease